MDYFISDIESEIEFIKLNKRKTTYVLTEGELTASERNDNSLIGIYKFDNKQLLNLAPDTGASFKINNQIYYGFIQFCDRSGIEITIEDYVTPFINSVEIAIETWRLLDKLKQRLSNLNQNKILKALYSNHKFPLPQLPNFIKGQDSAIRQSLSNLVSIIWGPPGTGKTYTLANIALENLKKNKRVLIVSQSNMAVDSAILQIKKLLNSDNPNHSVIRYGMVRSTELLIHTQYNSWDMAFSLNPKLELEYKMLQNIDLVKCNTLERNKILAKKKDIFNQISTQEISLINRAKIVATTATKATISKNIYEQNWDVVIFDEASMAYIPQIFIAASIAKSNLTIIGDFRQLSPIVQNDNSNRLKDDIFKYLHVTDSMHQVRKHPWLVILDKQWRMHPDIANYVNRKIYGMLQTAEQSKEQTKRIAMCEPFAGKVFSMIDYHQFQGICLKTESGSRFNVFSAILSIKTALIAANQNISVGIVTPYSAQAKIINSILQEISYTQSTQLPIYVATVHQFQGSERDVIIFDTTLNVPQEAGSILINSTPEDDNTMRLINVAITRTRGKFIIVGSKEYLQSIEISSELKQLVEYASKYYTATNNEIINILKFQDSVISVYFSNTTCTENFKALLNSNKFDNLDYWHTAKNQIKLFSNDKIELFNFILSKKITKRFYSTKFAKSGLPSIIPTINLKELHSSPPKDDFIILDEKIYCSNIIPVSNSYETIRIPFIIFSKNFVETFSKFAGLLKVINDMKIRKLEEKVNDSTFLNFISSKYHCSCGGSPKILISKRNSFWLQCDKCGNTISSYIEDDIYIEYMNKYKIRCKECNSPINISRYHKPYCSQNFKHDIGFNILELAKKEPTVFDSNKKKNKEQPKAIILKKKSKQYFSITEE